MEQESTRQLSRDSNSQQLPPFLAYWWINIPIKRFDLTECVKFSLCSASADSTFTAMWVTETCTTQRSARWRRSELQ